MTKEVVSAECRVMNETGSGLAFILRSALYTLHFLRRVCL